MNQPSPMAEHNTNQVTLEQTIQANPQKLTVEQEEERKLKLKYPNPQKPGGSAFIQKMLHKGSKKYFDSGDYNMAKSKKQGLLNGLNKGNALPPSVASETALSTDNVSKLVTEQCTLTSALNNDQAMPPADSSPIIQNNISNTLNDSLMNNITPETKNSSTNQSNFSIQTELEKLCTPNQKVNVNNNFNEHASGSSGKLNNSNTISTSPLSSSSLSTNLNNNSASNYYLNSMTQTSQSSQGISSHLSSSISSDKIAQIQINQQQLQLDSQEIGHGIPTPECLPQSRKHSIVQSKLATPRLSSS